MLPRKILLLVAALACAPFTVFAETAPATTVKPAAPAKLVVGEKAPEFKPTSWVQGEPVTSFEKGKTYIIECWATWCGPCIAQIPHLTKLQAEYGAKGLVIIGTNVWDKDAENAAAFVKKQGDKMPYRVAFDNKADGLVTKNWLVAGGVTGIPHAFAVRDGILIWHGHPGELNDATIGSMLAGTFDSAKSEKERVAREGARTKLGAASKKITSLIAAHDYDGAMKAADEFEALLPANGKISAEFARIRILTAKGEKTEALAKFRKLATAPDTTSVDQYNIAMNLLQGGLKGEKGAARLAADCLDRYDALVPANKNDPAVQNLRKLADKALEAEKSA